MDIAEFYLSSGLVSARFRKLVTLCCRLGMFLKAASKGETWRTAPNDLIDNRERQVIYTRPDQIFNDLEWGFMSFAHEIGHHLLPFSARKKRRLCISFEMREPVGLLQIPVEILAWVVGYAVILAVKESSPIASYAKYAAECVGTYVKYYFRR